MPADWRPTAALSALRQRATIRERLHSFFRDRGVLEVETPLLSQGTVTDLHLQSIPVRHSGRTCYLQTSPEFAMKRLLAAGSGAIYQLCKAFREDESGRLHNPEFTMLEWYRPGFDDVALMDEIEALLLHCLPTERQPQSPFPRVSYRGLFLQYLQVDPHVADAGQLEAVVRAHLDVGGMAGDRDDWLQLLFSHVIEPQLQDAVFVTDFPASQAALARVTEDEQGVSVARRFELFVDGVELANGYLELTDAAEQARRFGADNQLRRDRGLPEMPLDARLLAALEQGLPECAGVALGFDRLVMLAVGAERLEQVISFPAGNA